MRHIHVRAAVLLALFGGATLAYAFSTGPPVSRTGALGVAGKPAELNCTLCHNTPVSLNDLRGSLKIVGVPPQYFPGGVYNLQLQLNFDWNQDPGALQAPRKWGFEITAVQANSGDSAGTWMSAGIPPDSLQIKRYPALSTSTYKRRIYLEHTIGDYHLGENQDGQSGPIVWHLTWVAPQGDSGKVYFFAAGNAANGDSCSICGGDHIFTAMDSSTIAVADDVPVEPVTRPFVTSFERPYPNPMTQCLDLQFEIAESGFVDLSVFDLQGRRVRTLVHGHLAASSYGKFWNGQNDAGTQMKNGVYFIRLSAPGLRKPLSYRVTLAR